MKTPEEKNALAAEAMPRVEKIIRHMARKFGSDVDVDEIRSFAFDGLAQAIERFDASQNVHIGAFAAKRVEGQIIDGLTRNKMLPRRLIRQIAFLRKSREMLEYEQQSPPPQDKVEAVHRLADRLKDLACAYVTSCSSDENQQIECKSIPDSEDVTARKEYYGRLRAAIAVLPPKRQVLVQKYFYEDLTLEEVAGHLGKSRSWASRNLQTALATMRELFPQSP
jgi:RNA polymerase sigma factor FliA